MTKISRQIKEARKLALDYLQGDEQALPGACLYHALAVQQVMGGHILGGSYSWRFTNVDTGTNPTHFSCIFDQNAAMLAHELIYSGQWATLPILPEMHVWNVLSDGRVLDITTKHLDKFAMRVCGFQFDPDCYPPEFHLGDLIDNKAGNYLYKPELMATHLAKKAAAHVFNTKGK